MTIISAGVTSSTFHGTSETDIILIVPAESGGVGYAEVSADGITWRKWRPGNVLSPTQLQVGKTAPYVRFYCISGSIEIGVFTDKTAAYDFLPDHAAAHAAIGVPAEPRSLAGANKWFGGAFGGKSFNETNTTVTANYGTAQKVEAEAPFSAVRLVWVNRANNPITGLKAIIGATEAMDYSTAASAAHPVVGGTIYNTLATTTQINGYKTVTWNNGAASVDLADATLAPQLAISDRIPCTSVPRSAADQALGYTRPLLIIRAERTGTGSVAIIGNAGFGVLKDPIAEARYRILQLFWGANIVSTPSAVNGTRDIYSYEVFPIFEYDVPSLTVLGVGDSTVSNDGVGLTGTITSWGYRGCMDASSPARPINWANCGLSGLKFPEYWQRAQELVSAGLVPDVLLIEPISVNDYSPSLAAMDSFIEIGKSRAKEVVAYARANKISRVCFAPLFPYNPLNAAQDAKRKAFNSWLSSFAGATGNGYLDFSACGDGASPERWIPALNYNLDGIHPGQLAVETICAPALTAYLRSI